MENEKIRKLVLYKNYFYDFYDFYEKQNLKVKKKILWTFLLIETIEHIPNEYFKHIEGTNGLYEIRVQTGSNIFRIFSFF